MQELESRMTRKGQITIPAAIRNQLGLKAKDKVRFVQVADGVKVQPMASTLLRGYGAVTPLHRPENWTEVRHELERMVADDVANDSRS
jgi:AbrB family looped-hinge helix DNA binding protein